MKNKYLLLSLTIATTVVLLSFSIFKGDVTKKYVPRNTISQKKELGIKGAIEWVSRRRNNQITHTVDPKDIIKAQKEISSLRMKKNKSSLDLEWEELGPDNIGGRTRAILIDNDNPNLMFAGGVAGGLWKSTTAGQAWSQVTYTTDENFTNLAVVSICQATNGDIYFGTGEGMYHNSGTGTGGIEGAGIWKSTNHGETFTKLTSTWDTPEAQAIFVNVNKLAADPTAPNSIYAATKRGLRYTNDGGTTWNTTLNIEEYDTLVASDVKIASDGSIITSVGNIAFIKRKGIDNTFQKRSGDDEEDDSTLISDSQISRLEFAFAPSDPNYVYCAAAKTDGTLKNIYQSKDKGDTWKIIGNGGADQFQPFGTQGSYDNVIAVYPDNPEKILVGGLNIWRGTAVEGSVTFDWRQLTQWSLYSISPLYVHADQHAIVFNPINPTIIYIGSDGGISRAIDDGKSFTCQTMNTNYNVTQFYSVAYSGTGELLGGTQDNGTLYFNFQGNTPKNAFAILGGDGGYCEFSKLNPNILFVTMYYGNLFRTNDVTKPVTDFYSDRLITALTSYGAAFVTPVALWETKNDPLSTDTIYFVAKRNYYEGETINFKSQNSFDQPIEFIIEKNNAHPDSLSYAPDDTIRIPDPYQSIFALGLTKSVWITRMATNFTSSIGDNDWWSILTPTLLSYNETVEYLAFSNDGNNLFFSTSKNKLYRSSNLKNARSYLNADYDSAGASLVVNTQLIADFDDRAITSIATDPQNVENLVVTLGNYGNDDYVYFSTNAATTTSDDVNVNFASRQGDLPHAPVYSATFHYEGSEKVILGTEYGIFTTDLISGGHGQVSQSCAWTEENTGLDYVPVYMVREQAWENSWQPHISNHGFLYAATHGRGLFYSETLKGPVSIDENPVALNSANKINIDVYPNPIVDDANISYDITANSDVQINLYNIQGKLVKKVNLSAQTIGKHNYQLNIKGLPQGTYILNIVAGNKSNSKRVVVY